MQSHGVPSQELLRDLLRVVHKVRSRIIPDDRRLQLRDVYTLCYHVARELHGSFPDLRMMVGDLVIDRGPVQHHWIEIPSSEIYIDPAADQLDPFQPVRVGRTSDPDFTATHRDGVDSNFDLDDPRNRPELLFKPRSAWDPER